MTNIIEFIKQPYVKGSNRITINVNRNGKPFGQLWTYKDTATYKYSWCAKTLIGEHETFYASNKTSGETKARLWIINQGE